MDTTQCLSEVASHLRQQHVRVFVLPEHAIANFVVLRPNEVKPTRFAPPLTTIHTNAKEKVPALVDMLLTKVHVMLDSLKGFLDDHDYDAFVTLNELDVFGADEILRLAYQAAVIQKKSIVDVVTDEGYGSLQDLHDSTIDKRY